MSCYWVDMGFSPLDSHRLGPSHGVAVVPSRDLSRNFGVLPRPINKQTQGLMHPSGFEGHRVDLHQKTGTAL